VAAAASFFSGFLSDFFSGFSSALALALLSPGLLSAPGRAATSMALPDSCAAAETSAVL
jgi:hypothetical protein